MTLRPTFLIASLLATSFSAPQPTRPTPPQQLRWAEVAHKYEGAPLDKSANLDAADTVNQILQAKDFKVVLCPKVFSELRSSPYRYRTEVLRLFTLGSATYQIESRKTDGEGTSLYAFHSMLKGYAAILRQDPEAKDKDLQEMAELDALGQLQHLAERKGCM